jgi:hypothetical protein
MSERTKLGLRIGVAAVLMGVLGDNLLREFPWGLNFALWAAALAVVCLALAAYRSEALAGGGYWLLAPAVLFPFGTVWRGSAVLKALDVTATLIALSLLVLRAQGRKIRDAGLFEYALGGAVAGLNAAFAPFLLLIKDIRWLELKGHHATKPALAVGRGILFSIPPFFVFAGLLMSADPVFKDLIENTLHLSLLDVIVHSFFAALFTWIVAGLLRGTLMGDECAKAMKSRMSWPHVGITESAIVLGLVDFLFLAFVLVQLRYFFGGADLVQKSIGLTYAEYARNGFFELVAVAALVLPLLLVSHWLLAKDKPENERVFRYLAGAQILLLFVIMTSALQRMRLYQREYGLTELRVYTMAFMLWLAVVFVWFTATVLRGQRKWFAFGALATGYLSIVVLHGLNPDALIARTNLARAYEGRAFDANYVSSLSEDAAPVLVHAIAQSGQPSLSPQDRCKLSAHLLENWSARGEDDWRTWSWARTSAYRVVQENVQSLRAVIIRDKSKNK